MAMRQLDEAVVKVRGRHRHVLAEPERVVLVDPAVVARLGAVLADAFEAGPRILVERPALRAMIARCLWSVERTFALAAVEAADVAARERHPGDALAVDGGGAPTGARQRGG